MSLLGYGTIKFGLYYQIMIDCLAIDECARGTHCRKIMCAGLQEPKFMGRFSLILEWVSGETPMDILEMSHLHCMFGKQHE